MTSPAPPAQADCDPAVTQVNAIPAQRIHDSIALLWRQR